MSKKPESGNPFLDAWLAGQEQFFKTQDPLIPKMTSMMSGDDMDVSGAMRRAQENWALCEQQAADWMKAAGRWVNPKNASAEQDQGIAGETLRRMLDPSRFLYAGLDEINLAIQRLVEGPEFADIGTLERQTLKATREWLALREASAAYHAQTAQAWSRAFATFSKEMAAKPSAMSGGVRTVLDRWLTIANEELIRTQRTNAFLDAQRKLLRAGVEYRLKERELVEVWCDTHSIPTRTEIDDLHRTVYDLRRQVRDLSKRLAASETRPKQAAPESRPKRTAPRGKSAAAKKPVRGAK